MSDIRIQPRSQVSMEIKQEEQIKEMIVKMHTPNNSQVDDNDVPHRQRIVLGNMEVTDKYRTETIQYSDNTGYVYYVKPHSGMPRLETILYIKKFITQYDSNKRSTEILNDKLTDIEMKEALRDFEKYLTKKITRRPFSHGR